MEIYNLYFRFGLYLSPQVLLTNKYGFKTDKPAHRPNHPQIQISKTSKAWSKVWSAKNIEPRNRCVVTISGVCGGAEGS